MDKEFHESIERLIELENESVVINSRRLQDLMDMGVHNINQLDHVADRLLDTMHGLTGAGEEMYRQYLDYMATFDPVEAKKRSDDLEYDLGYKTYVLYAAAILCRKEMENLVSPDRRPSFQVVMDDYIPKVHDIHKKTASFLFFAHFVCQRPVEELMLMLRTITEETDYVKAHVEEFEDLMYFPNETYHPLSEDEWQKIQYIAEHNIQLYNQHLELNKELMHNVFGRDSNDKTV